MSLTTVLVIFGIGSLAGLIGALFGLGGGILIVPVLAIGFGVPMHTAIATSLLCGIATSSAAASRNIRLGIANVRLGLLLEPWTVTGAIAGGLVAGLLPGETLMKIFGVCIIGMAIPMGRVLGEKEPPKVEDEPSPLSGAYFDAASGRDVRYAVERLPFAMGISSVAGVLSGLLGVGGGIIQVPALTLVCRLPMKAAAATSNFMIGVTAVASAIIYYGRGYVSPPLAAACVIGVFLGSRVGVVVSGRIHGEAIRKAFALVMVVIGIRLLVKAYGIG
jgi:hypothetical protein